MIDERKNAEKKSERSDLFNNLLDANMEEEEGKETRLADSELIGTLVILSLYFVVLTTRSHLFRGHLHLPSCWTRG